VRTSSDENGAALGPQVHRRRLYQCGVRGASRPQRGARALCHLTVGQLTLGHRLTRSQCSWRGQWRQRFHLAPSSLSCVAPLRLHPEKPGHPTHLHLRSRRSRHTVVIALHPLHQHCATATTLSLVVRSRCPQCATISTSSRPLAGAAPGMLMLFLLLCAPDLFSFLFDFDLFLCRKCVCTMSPDRMFRPGCAACARLSLCRRPQLLTGYASVPPELP